MPPTTCCLLQLVCGETHFLFFRTLDESELLLNSSKPMISCHRIFPASEDWCVGLHKTTVSTWLLHSGLVGIHHLYHIDHPFHHVILCLAMGFIPMEQLLQGRHSVWWWWRCCWVSPPSATLETEPLVVPTILSKTHLTLDMC